MKKLTLLLFIFGIALLSQTQQTAAQTVSDENTPCEVQGALFSSIHDKDLNIIHGLDNAEEDGFSYLTVVTKGNCEAGIKVKIESLRLTATEVDGVMQYAHNESNRIINIDDERGESSEDKGVQNTETPGKALFIIPKVEKTSDPYGFSTSVMLFKIGSSGCYDSNGVTGFADCYFTAKVLYDGALKFDSSTFFKTPKTASEVYGKYSLEGFTTAYTDSMYPRLEKHNDILFANCDGGCDNSNWDLENTLEEDGSSCKINSVKWNDLTSPGSNTQIAGKSGALTIDQSGCHEGFFVKMIWVNYNLLYGGAHSSNFSDSYIENYPKNEYFIPKKNQALVLNFALSEGPCLDRSIGTDALLSGYAKTVITGNGFVASDADCAIGVEIYSKKGKRIYSNQKEMLDNEKVVTYPDVFNEGLIFLECLKIEGGDDTTCRSGDNDVYWKLVGSDSIDASNSQQPTAFSGVPVNYDPSSPCYRPGGNGLEEGYHDNCYELLAPIPGIEQKPGGGADTDLFEIKNGRIAIKDINTYQFGDFFNKLFQLAIAILAVISVIMIVVAGVQYMTVESFYGKGEAKQRIISAVGGLILALGIYTILHTINPKLLEVNFGSGFKIQEIELWDGGLSIDLSNVSGTPIQNTDSSDARALDPTWAKQNAPTIKLTKKSGGSIVVKACDTSQFERYPAFDTKIYTHKAIRPTMERISQKWVNGGKTYKIKSIGGYNCRLIKPGGKSLSTHSYGLTVDINPKENPYGKKLVTDMPDDFVKLFKDEGFGWGGDWSSIKDAMHFSKVLNEKGDQIVD